MKTLGLVGVSLLCWAAGGPLQGQERDQDLAKLKGLWDLEFRSSNGQEFKAAKLLRFQMRLDGDQMTTLVKGKETVTEKFVIDSSKNPKTLDRILNSNGKVLGIYKLEGDTLTVAVSPANLKDRPAAFESAKGSPTILSVYKRVQ